MNILSLFDGISCGMIALERAGIEVDTYYASEIEANAIKISEKNYPNIIRLGNVTKWKEWSINWSSIDLLIGGSPCQGFSFAGKQLNFNDERSKLFFEYVDILNHIKQFNPKVKFLLENVKMKQEYEDIITKYLNVNPIKINSIKISASNRERIYWANFNIRQPIEKNITFKDIYDSNEKNKKYVIEEKLNQIISWKGYEKKKEKAIKDYNCKLPCLLARGYQQNQKMMFLIYDNNKYRYITHNEAELAMTLPLNYTDADVSPRERERAIGNGWTVDVIAHIFSFLPDEYKI